MNYIILNDNEFFNGIQLDNFKEVSADGRERVDGIFGSITEEILAESFEDDREGDRILRREWICRDSGVIFVVLRIPQNILYDGAGQSLERCLGIFNPEDVYVEMGAVKLENKENTYEYFLIAYNKNLGFHIILDKEFPEKKEEDIIPFLCGKIKKIL